jgi:hypothetical protein
MDKSTTRRLTTRSRRQEDTLGSQEVVNEVCLNTSCTDREAIT